MRVFKGFNQSGKDVCPVCGTNDDKETVLVAIDGTQEGNNCQAIQVHLDCIELNYDPETGIIYQLIR